ncbi:hypothetical protein [Ancylobacter sp.]|uniref:hypothetical protein n=1 Tax=Ancylobacter sp. TaxID=1872567 RepID=UPI003D0F8F3F
MNAVALAGFWALAFWALFSRRQMLFWLFFGTLPLGSFAVIPIELTGGLSLLATHVTAAFIVIQRFFFHRNGLKNLLSSALRVPGLLLTLFWLVALLVTMFAPRLLAGRVDVAPMTVTEFMQVSPLRPTLQNFSQLSYVTLSVLMVFSAADFFRSPRNHPLILRGLLFSSGITIATGILSYLATFLPLDSLLDPFKTAGYTLLDEASIGDGTRRITGLMPEASAFGALTLALLSCLYFLRHAIDDRVQLFRTNVVIVMLAVLLVMSTSSAGYVGLGVLGALVGLDWFTRAFRINRPRFAYRGVRQDFFLALAIVGFAALAVMATPGVFDPVMQRLDEIIFSKVESASYLERSGWTATSMQAGFDSYLIGVGLGSTRASNFAAVLFGSTGLLGFLLYFSFIGRILLTPAPKDDQRAQAVSSALKWSFFPVFSVSLLIGTTPDFGVFEAFRFGALMALSQAGAVAIVHAEATPEIPHRPLGPTSAAQRLRR